MKDVNSGVRGWDVVSAMEENTKLLMFSAKALKHLKARKLDV